MSLSIKSSQSPSLSGLSLLPQMDGSKALDSKDLKRLKELYAAHGNRLLFLKEEEIQHFLDSIVEKNDLDVEIMDWLLPLLPSSSIVNHCAALFQRSAAWGDEGLPLMKSLLPALGDLADESCFEECFRSALEQKAKGLLLLQWLLERAGNKIDRQFSRRYVSAIRNDETGRVLEFFLKNFDFNESNISSVFYLVIRQKIEGLPATMKLFWPIVLKTPYRDDLFKAIIEEMKTSSNAPCLLDFVLEQLLLLQGTADYPKGDWACQFSSENKEAIDAYLKKRGLPFTSTENETRVDTRRIFEKMTPDGFALYVDACKTMPALSPFSVRWAFLKAAANGEAGTAFMEWLCKNRGAKLSYWTLEEAFLMLSKNGHEKAAEGIKTLQKGLFKDLEKSPIDNADFQLQLAISCNPSGYRPLGETPNLCKWKPITQEELDTIPPTETSATPIQETTFDDAEEVEDNTENPAPHQVRKSEAALFRRLYASILQGKTVIKVEGSDFFKKEIYKL